MSNSLFRKASIDRVSSPEQLNQYIRVTRPGVWVTLAAVILLLVGMIIWAAFGTIESSIETAVLVEGGNGTCYVSEEDVKLLEKGMKVDFDGADGTIESISAVPVQIKSDIDPYLLYCGDFAAGDFRYVAEVGIQGLADGVYRAKITVESIHPITFVTH